MRARLVGTIVRVKEVHPAAETWSSKRASTMCMANPEPDARTRQEERETRTAQGSHQVPEVSPAGVFEAAVVEWSNKE
jgi:hypothetical protein